MHLSKKIIFLVTLLVFYLAISVSAAQMTFEEEKEKGWLTLKDGEIDLLTYRFGDQIEEGIDPGQTRSCYIHPIFSLDGKSLTDDFPADHPHHHGLSWTWPVVKTRGQETQTWHPANLRQYFVRWLKREVLDGTATLSVENVWKLDGKEEVAKEVVSLNVHPIDEFGRTIDLELSFEAVGGTLEIGGTPDQNKGYGGLTLRGAPAFKGFSISTDEGEIEGEPNNVRLRWADLSEEDMGVAIFVSPDHPDFPPPWVLRTSYAGLLNVSWPGLRSFTIQPGKRITLRYRLLIHQGKAAKGQVRRVYERYISAFKK